MATVLVDASAGDAVTLSFGDASVVAPDGTLVATTVSPLTARMATHFEAAMDGTYEITFLPDRVPHVVHASTPKQYQGEWDVPLDIAPDLPGQVIEVGYDGTAG